MKTSAYLAGLSRKLIELDYGDLVEVVGVAAGLVDPDKELSKAQMQEITGAISSGLGSDDNNKVELGIGLAELIRRV